MANNQPSQHPLALFEYCPKCGAHQFHEHNEKAKKCNSCGFIYYFNPSAAVVCIICDKMGNLLVARRAHNPGKGLLDMPGGFVDANESAEQAAKREVMEECNLQINQLRYLFSIPNLYPYSGFTVHTLDLFFQCTVDHFDHVQAADDVEHLYVIAPSEIDIDAFAFSSVREGLKRFLSQLK